MGERDGDLSRCGGRWVDIVGGGGGAVDGGGLDCGGELEGGVRCHCEFWGRDGYSCELWGVGSCEVKMVCLVMMELGEADVGMLGTLTDV